MSGSNPPIPDRAERKPMRLRMLRIDRPTKPATQLLEMVAAKSALRHGPDHEDWAIRAGIARAAEISREVREATGLSQKEFAELAGTTQSVVGDIERGAGTYGAAFSVVFKILAAHGYDLKLQKQHRSETARTAVGNDGGSGGTAKPKTASKN